MLTEAGFSLAEIAALMDAGVLATAPPADHGRTMTPALFRTRMTELFGIRHPILAGGLMWLSDARYVAAVVNAGGMGFITSRSFATLDAFRTELALCDHLTGGKPFGVNLSTSRHTAIPLADYVQAALEAGVRCFETSGRAPADDLIAAIRRGECGGYSQSAVGAGTRRRPSGSASMRSPSWEWSAAGTPGSIPTCRR